MQLASLVHETADSVALCAPGIAGIGNALQLLPSHISAAALGLCAASGPVCPTAMHRARAGQEIPVRVSCPGATGSIFHVRPFQDSANANDVPPLRLLPVAMHWARPAHDTAYRPRA